MGALLADVSELSFAKAQDVLPGLAGGLRDGRVVPYLGPQLLTAANPDIPATPEALAAFFQSKVALPSRARGNAWAAAQYIESTRHRATVTALMAEAFATPAKPTDLHHMLAALDLPLIVDSWYDGAMRSALETRDGWGEIQGITRAGIGEDQWYRFYDRSGEKTDVAAATCWKTILYKPHGGIVPARNFLISDADYVEVLTEIDIQTPIPEMVRDRRTEHGFLFFGCRFHDQLLRTYARQIMKRSAGPHYVIVDPADTLTRNEARFLAAQEIIPISATVEEAAGMMLEAA
ncbi:SIR2 family NAD-dependent protein deacylase [Roseibium litorale]|uniref:SIR2 family protein n=1 Tax=Roseibium litorale TaxID=2803841 RepID=A0ABR9CRP7_9HYPH|nr:SIR2 family protein [Roseibium litorale]MBD8893353.1 SIR2 family protein [Roseibium litorale]